MRFASLRIISANLPALSSFYREIIGIEPTAYTEDYLEFKTPACILAVGSKRSMDRYGNGAAKPAANQTAILEFQVDDVDKEYARLKLSVARFELEPTTQPWGNRSMLFRDPDGNLINFFTPISDAAQAKYSS